MEKHGKRALSGRGKFTDWFLLQIRAGDTFAVSQGMWAKMTAELKSMGVTKDTATPEQLSKAIEAAEDTTGRTQPSFGIDTLSAIQNGGSFMKLMTMFQNQPNKYFRMIGDNMRNFKYGRGSRAKAASTILLTWVVLPMLFQFIADAFQWKEKRQARAAILGPANFILIGGQLVQSIWGWLSEEPFDWSVSPVLSTVDEIRKALVKAKQMVERGQDPYEDITADDTASLIEYLAKAMGQLTGMPTPYFVQTERAIRHNIEAGEPLDIKDFLFSEWALTGEEKDYFPKEDFEKYNSIPSNDLELKIARRNKTATYSRDELRECNPELDAKLFISGQVTAIKPDSRYGSAYKEVLRLVSENKINPEDIRAVKAWQKEQEQRQKLGLRDTNITLTENLIQRLLRAEVGEAPKGEAPTGDIQSAIEEFEKSYKGQLPSGEGLPVRELPKGSSSMQSAIDEFDRKYKR